MLFGKFSYFVGYAHNPSDKAEFSWMGFLVSLFPMHLLRELNGSGIVILVSNRSQ